MAVQLGSTAQYWPIAPARRPRVKGLVYVVARRRAVQPRGAWSDDDRGYADEPLTPPLSDLQITEQFPTLGIRLGDERPHGRGKIREYLAL